MELPPLPEPLVGARNIWVGFTAAQMRSYATAAVAAAIAEEREACAKVCDDKERRKWSILSDGGRLEGFGPLDCAAAIRARSAPRTQEG